MLHLDRPIFDWPINWSDPLNKSFAFDLREIQLGFGAEVFTSLQDDTVQGFQYKLDLRTDEEIKAFDDFFAALTGRVNGFWLPSPFEALQIVAAVSSTQFTIANQQLAETWEEHPSVHLFFTHGGIAQAAKILNVESLGGGWERVTLDTEIALELLVPETSVHKLHYVRLANDVEKGTFVAEGRMKRSVSVVELPSEYAAIETGETKIFLFHFFCASPVDRHWRYTNFAADVISQNERFTKAAMKFGSLKSSINADDQGVEIEAAHDANSPLALFFPIPCSRPLRVEILETTFADPDTTKKLFGGTVRSVDDNGESLTANCDSWAAVLARKMPRMFFQENCNNVLYDAKTCKAIRAQFETSGAISSIAARTITVTLDFPNADRQGDNWFAQGFIETGSGLKFETRTVLNSTWDADASQLTLKLNYPLQHAVNGQRLQLIPGCDGAADTCRDKFNNFVNFGGFPDIPTDNLSLKAVDAKVSAGGKK